ncbi:glycosyltransferase family 9 protein [Geothrix sp. PMB-07]|uniref:glycosyltransferase family 9 protein n=1 Tax=Geothrix sp. PMB-07 TaxID=3068640 RepID=UPI0027406BAB|nr:glycosyltransferase family 9 protein [Geothrix sp. PMB-07]WLT33234.1 glycosyltransferase family 9 protein [Geothrix sp. PMB-07]
MGKVKPGQERLREVLPSFDQPEVWIRFPRQLGDVIFAIPFLHGLQQSWNAVAAAQGKTIRWVAVGHAIGAAIFSEAHPDFIAESVIEAGKDQKPDPWGLIRRWRKQPPVAFINLSQSARLAFAAWTAGVPIRAGIADNSLSLLYHYPFIYRDLPVHLVRRYEPLLEQLTGSSRLEWMPMRPDRLGGEAGFAKLRQAGWQGEPFITLAFGTRGFNKRWFPEVAQWTGIARIAREKGFGVVWLGGPDEVELGNRLAGEVPGSWNLTGQTTMPEACAIQSVAWGNVAVDTGLAHTAAGTGRPTVTVNGVSPEQLINPLGPFALSVRGPCIDVSEDPTPLGPEEIQGTAHRVTPLRVWNLLEGLVMESEGRLLGAKASGENHGHS